MKRAFIDILPKYLMIERPKLKEKYFKLNKEKQSENSIQIINLCEKLPVQFPEKLKEALGGIVYMHRKLKEDHDDRLEIDDWKYVAMVIDRLFLYVS